MAGDLEPEILIWKGATIALLILSALLAWPLVRRYREPPPPPPPTLRLALTPPAGADFAVGDDGLDAALSPDGRELAFVASANGRVQLWLRRVDDLRAAPVSGSDGARAPSWSPDGRALLFFAGGRLKRAPASGGAATDLAGTREPGGAAWLDDGSIVLAGPAPGGLIRLREGAAPSTATTLEPGDRAHRWPARAPGGFIYIAARDDGRRVIRLVANGRTHDLGSTDGHALIVDSILLHVRGGALLAQRIDPADGTAIGRATAVATDVGTADGRALVAASSRLLLLSGAATRLRELVWLDERGARQDTASERGDYWQVRLSPDDAAAAVTMLEPQLRTLDVYVLPLLRGSTARSLSLALAADTDPVWSPDGRRVLFRSFQDGVPHLFARAVGVEGAAVEPISQSTADQVPTDWHGGTVLLHAPGARGDTDLLVFTVAGATARPAVASGFNETDGRWSPDGRFLAYVSDEFGQPDVFVQRWPGGGRVRVTTAGGVKPRWGRDARTLYLLRGDEIARVAVKDGPKAGAAPSVSPPAGVARVPGLRDYDVSHRGTRLLAVLPAGAAPSPDVRALVDWEALVPGPKP